MERKQEIAERVRFFLVLFSILAGGLSMPVNGTTILFGSPRPSPELANSGITGLLVSFAAVTTSLYFLYTYCLLLQPFFPTLFP